MSVKEQLILAGIEEIEERGVQEFSLRKVATRCGVSCAAPYKHFRDKQDFILNIIRYINHKWNEIQENMLARFRSGPEKILDTGSQLLELCMGYVRFLVDNPHFRSIIVMMPHSGDPEQQRVRHELSAGIKKLVHDHCTQMKIPERLENYKLYTVRSLIYGAAMFIENGQLPNNEATMSMVREAISNELSSVCPAAQ